MTLFELPIRALRRSMNMKIFCTYLASSCFSYRLGCTKAGDLGMRKSGSVSCCIPEEPECDQSNEKSPKKATKGSHINAGDSAKEDTPLNKPFRAGYSSTVELKEMDAPGILLEYAFDASS